MSSWVVKPNTRTFAVKDVTGKELVVHRECNLYGHRTRKSLCPADASNPHFANWCKCRSEADRREYCRTHFPRLFYVPGQLIPDLSPVDFMVSKHPILAFAPNHVAPNDDHPSSTNSASHAPNDDRPSSSNSLSRPPNHAAPNDDHSSLAPDRAASPPIPGIDIPITVEDDDDEPASPKTTMTANRSLHPLLVAIDMPESRPPPLADRSVSDWLRPPQSVSSQAHPSESIARSTSSQPVSHSVPSQTQKIAPVSHAVSSQSQPSPLAVPSAPSQPLAVRSAPTQSQPIPPVALQPQPVPPPTQPQPIPPVARSTPSQPQPVPPVALQPQPAHPAARSLSPPSSIPFEHPASKKRVLEDEDENEDEPAPKHAKIVRRIEDDEPEPAPKQVKVVRRIEDDEPEPAPKQAKVVRRIEDDEPEPTPPEQKQPKIDGEEAPKKQSGMVDEESEPTPKKSKDSRRVDDDESEPGRPEPTPKKQPKGIHRMVDDDSEPKKSKDSRRADDDDSEPNNQSDIALTFGEVGRFHDDIRARFEGIIRQVRPMVMKVRHPRNALVSASFHYGFRSLLKAFDERLGEADRTASSKFGNLPTPPPPAPPTPAPPSSSSLFPGLRLVATASRSAPQTQ